jgi:hypothetical protein
MKLVKIYTTDKEYRNFVELARHLPYVKKIETEDDPSKEETIDNIKKGFEELKQYKKGKLKTSSLKDFLDEL